MTTVPVRRHNHVRRLASDRVFDGVLYTIAAILTLMALYPMYFIIIASISDPSLVAQGKILLLPRGVTLEGYEHLASMKNLWVGYGNTILYTIAGTAIMLVVNIPVAYALSRRDLVGRRWFTLFFVFPMFFGGGLIPTFIIINNWFHLLDTFTVMVLPFSVIAYYIIVARTFFQSSLPAELWDAAQIDGCGNLRYFFTIVLPLSKAIISVIALWAAVALAGLWLLAQPPIRRREQTASQFSSWYAAGVAVGLYGVGQTAWYVQLGKLRDLPLLALFLAAAVWCTVRQFWRLGGEPDETRRRQERIIALLYTVAQGVLLLLTAEAGFGLVALVLHIGVYFICAAAITWTRSGRGKH